MIRSEFYQQYYNTKAIHTLIIDLQALLNTPTRVTHTEIPNTPDIPTPPSRASTQSWDSQNRPRPGSSLAVLHDSQLSQTTLSSDSSTVLSTPPYHAIKASRDKRLQIQTTLLFNIPHKEICEKLHVTKKQIRRAKKYRFTPQKTRAGRHPLLNTPQRARLQLWLQDSPSHHRIPYRQIPQFFPEWHVGEDTIRTVY